MLFLAILLLHSYYCSLIGALKVNGASCKQIFLSSVNTNQRISTKELEDLIASDLNFLQQPNFKFRDYDTFGVWKVKCAPHIDFLSQFLFTKFTVYYKFGKGNEIISNVKYSSKLFGNGWLNTRGKIEILDSRICELEWQKVWWDWCTDEPSSEMALEQHILPSIIQPLGLLAFIKSASVFPIDYFDEDLCVFTFSLTNTVVCSQRLSKLPVN